MFCRGRGWAEGFEDVQYFLFLIGSGVGGVGVETNGAGGAVVEDGGAGAVFVFEGLRRILLLMVVVRKERTLF